ncbi:MAG: tagaturonate reductase [Flavobacteriaceae bacterium]|jgi:tagaturonate reductase
MNKLSRKTTVATRLPIKILQYGEGNFLRGFVDWFVDSLNEKTDYQAGVAVIQPINHGMVEMITAQDGLFHHMIQGIESGELVDEARLNNCIQKAINPFTDPSSYYALASSSDLKLIFSNTTETGIVFDENDKLGDTLAITFPGKLVQFLKKRFESLGNAPDSEIGVVPCELVESNGDELKKCVQQYADLWQLDSEFKKWIVTNVHFANTLVDRIVPGYPKDEIDVITERIGFDDNLVVKSESFHLFVIEGDEFIQTHFPAHKHGFNVKYVESITPYRTQKVRILNGAHTSMMPVGLLSGIETVKETVEDDQVGNFVQKAIFEEIVKTIDIPCEDPAVFADQVLARFKNPFIRHELISISLNSVSKWKVRVLPTVLDYLAKNGELPKRLTFSLACLIKLYLSDNFQLKDDESILSFFAGMKSSTDADLIVKSTLSNVDFWGQDLSKVSGMSDLVMTYFKAISSSSVRATLDTLSV